MSPPTHKDPTFEKVVAAATTFWGAPEFDGEGHGERNVTWKHPEGYRIQAMRGPESDEAVLTLQNTGVMWWITAQPPTGETQTSLEDALFQCDLYAHARGNVKLLLAELQKAWRRCPPKAGEP